MLVLLAVFFVEVPNALPNQPCGPGQGTGCYTNYAQLTDLDGDGDLDVLLPNGDGYFAKGVSQPFVVYRNEGSMTFTDASSILDGGFSGWIRQIAVGDVDGDADLDVFAPDAWGEAPDALFVNDGTGNFTNDPSRIGTTSRAGSTRFADVDADGDLDLVIADWGATPPTGAWSIAVHENDGTGTFTPFALTLPAATADGTGPVDIDPFDADGDFDLDLLVDAHDGNLQLWIRDANGFTDASASLADQPGGLHYGPAVCDADGDGDLDVWIDNAAVGQREQLLLNSAGTFVDVTAQRVSSNPVADDNGVACVDVDDDGDFDAAIASLSANERVLVNDSGMFAPSAGAFTTVADATLWFDFGDLDGDGRLDAVTAQGESGASFIDRIYAGDSSAPVDTRAPHFRALEQLTEESPRARFAIADSAVTDTGPRIDENVYLELTGGAPSPAYAPAHWMGGDLFVTDPLPAFAAGSTITYRACASDLQGNAGCSDTKSYVVTGATGDDDGGGGGCGCSTTGSPSTLGSLAALALLAVRRARRSLLCGSRDRARCP